MTVNLPPMSEKNNNIYINEKPEIDESVFIAENAVVLGKVTVGKNTSIWFNAVIRGDIAPIDIGKGCNIQDGCIIHVDADKPAVLKNGVGLGHGAVVHGAVLEDGVLIGMNATVLSGARIGSGSIVAAGAVVLQDADIPEESVAAGVPARIVGKVTKEQSERMREIEAGYKELAHAYKNKVHL